MGCSLLKLVDLLRSIMCDATTKIQLAENVDDVLAAMAKRLHLPSRADWPVFGSCLYTLEDAAMAIRAYFSTVDNDFDKDFEYLRLFGFLNACYLQLGALEQLLRIVNVRDSSALIAKLKKHDLIQCRHMLASHTLAYQDGDEVRSITIRQCDLGGTGATFEVNETNERNSFDFSQLFESWTIECCALLGDTVRKFVATVYKPNPEKQADYLDRLQKLLREGRVES